MDEHERIKEAMNLERSGDLDGAIYVGDGLVDHHTQSMAALLLAGQLHLAAAKRAGEMVQRRFHLKRATLLLDRAKGLGENNLGVARARAHVLLETNRMEEAKDEIRRALSLQLPDDPNDLVFRNGDGGDDVNRVYVPPKEQDDIEDQEDAIEDRGQKKYSSNPTHEMKKMLREFEHYNLSSIQVVGKSRIIITKYGQEMGGTKKSPGLCYNVGEVKYLGAAELPGRKATILVFVDDKAEQLHNLLRSVSHPNVVRSLGYVRGTGVHSPYTMVALPFFDTTFEMYLLDDNLSIYMGRYNEIFIGLISDVVTGISALHSAGYCCNGLSGKHIAVTKENGFISAKIWCFQKCLSEKEKNYDWTALGSLLNRSQRKSKEIRDFCNKLISGKLRGMDILAHSAALTVRKKFQNVVALYFNQATHWKSGSADTPAWLDGDFSWDQFTPPWIKKQSLSTPANSKRGFCEKLRHLVEHEVDFLQPNIIVEPTYAQVDDGASTSDLECSMREAWGVVCLELQELVTKYKLAY